MESEGPYNPYKHQTEMWGTKECDKQCKACIYAEGRKAAEKDFQELLDNTGFLATILHQIAYKWIHVDDDIPGEGCDCPKEFARESLRLSCEEFFAWKKARGIE